jgi:hypothetical protein
MEAIIVKIFATALALSQVTTTPDDLITAASKSTWVVADRIHSMSGSRASANNRDRGWPHGLPLPHHRAYGSVHGGSVG